MVEINLGLEGQLVEIFISFREKGSGSPNDSDAVVFLLFYQFGFGQGTSVFHMLDFLFLFVVNFL